VRAGGSLLFEHVRPDRYRLVLEGEGVPDTTRAIDVPTTGLDLGTVRLDAPASPTTGRIEGRVWYPKGRDMDRREGPWAFADGHVDGFRERGPGGGPGIEFQADENGRFHVDGVPAGRTTVRFPYQVFDVIRSYDWEVQVVAGRTTQVRAFEPGDPRRFTLKFIFGDGSKAQYQSGTGLGAARQVENVTLGERLRAMFVEKPMPAKPRPPTFLVDLEPLSRGPLAFARPEPFEIGDRPEDVLPDVSPGTYRLRVRDWYRDPFGLSGPDGELLFDQEVVVPPGGAGEVRLALGAGCITGKVHAPEDNDQWPVGVTAVIKGGSTSARRAWCDFRGNFCDRFLSPGTYTVFVNDPAAGYCRVDDVVVGAGVVDVGERALTPGATVRGEVRFPRPSPVPDEVVAEGPSGVTVRRKFAVDESFDRVDLRGLWPGHWTITARSHDHVIARGEVEIIGTGTQEITLTAGGDREP
jgi:hypothetical protein